MIILILYFGGLEIVKKLELLRCIERLAAIIHDEAIVNSFSEKTAMELRNELDELSERYISVYCNAGNA
ncbi:hypothetical protein SDC9_11237 [bioreactor metagenome]|uniref:Uncharacterized protein n=1 Tax=bioreactor metagenome TaxID=1076179 RepID=A0A644TF95_9ZZZZ